jgi:hypothetical protein
VMCASTRSSTSSPRTPFVVTGVPATSIDMPPEPAGPSLPFGTLACLGIGAGAGLLVLAGRPARIRSVRRSGSEPG